MSSSKRITVKEINDQLKQVHSLDDERLKNWVQDDRKGVQLAISKTIKRLQTAEKQQQAFRQRFTYEQSFWHKGINYVAGIDEVGRGPLAGPVVSAAVILPSDFDLIAVNDSKQLSKVTRELLAPQIEREALAYGFGVIDNQIIDEVNIYEATKLAMRAAVNDLNITPQQLIIDAMSIDMAIPELSLIKADAKSVSVSAASILAKVYRDQMMSEYDQQYPEYEFAHNDGYGTKVHLKALAEFGVTPIHRRSFKPVMDALGRL